MKKFIIFMLLLTILLIVAYSLGLHNKVLNTSNEQSLHSKQTLVFGIHPFLDENNLNYKFLPLVDYLSKALNKEITLKISPSYQEHVELMGKDIYDLAYLGPSNYIQMVDKYNQKKILASMTTYDLPYFNGIIFSNSNSNIYSLKDLKNKRFAFGKASSTMSSLVPQKILNEQKVFLDDFSEYKHFNNHDEVVRAVISGTHDAGAVKETVFEKYKKIGLREIARSNHIAEHVFVASNSMPERDKQEISQLLLNLSSSKQGKEILHRIKPKSYNLKMAVDRNFNSLRNYLDMKTTFTWDFNRKTSK